MRNLLSLVSQEPVLFDCSIEDNVKYGLKDVGHDKIVESAKLANIHEFIQSLPEVMRHYSLPIYAILQ